MENRLHKLVEAVQGKLREEKNLYTWNWGGTGYNQTYANSEEEAKEYAKNLDAELYKTMTNFRMVPKEEEQSFWDNYPMFDGIVMKGGSPINEGKDAEKLMHDALMVITKDANIRAWLEANDPKALEQAEFAVGAYVDPNVPTGISRVESKESKVNEQDDPSVGRVKVDNYEDAPYVVYALIGEMVQDEFAIDDYEGIANALAQTYHIDMPADQVKEYLIDVVGESKEKPVKETFKPTELTDSFLMWLQDNVRGYGSVGPSKEDLTRAYGLLVGYMLNDLLDMGIDPSEVGIKRS